MQDYYLTAHQRIAEHETRLAPDGSILISKEDRRRNHLLTSRKPDQSRINRWKLEMNIEEQQRFEKVAGDLLGKLGYPTISRR